MRRAKSLGFSLDEIRGLLALSEQSQGDTSVLMAAASAKLMDVEAKLAELTRLRDGLRMLVEACSSHAVLDPRPTLHMFDEDP